MPPGNDGLYGAAAGSITYPVTIPAESAISSPEKGGPSTAGR